MVKKKIKFADVSDTNKSRLLFLVALLITVVCIVTGIFIGAHFTRAPVDIGGTGVPNPNAVLKFIAGNVVSSDLEIAAEVNSSNRLLRLMFITGDITVRYYPWTCFEAADGSDT
eukprot:Lankesteria_metandrocarpae@DN8922_c0_g1_i1.p1